MNFRPFADITELIAELKKTDHLYYRAPLDPGVGVVHVRSYTISNVNFEKSKATLHTRVTGCFTVKLTEHFNRFRMRVEG